MNHRSFIFASTIAISLGLWSAGVAAPPPAPNVTSPSAGAVLGANRPDLTWSAITNDGYEVHIGSFNIPSSANGWNSGQVITGQPVSAVTSGPLAAQQAYYVFVRLHNADGWGDWSPPSLHFSVTGELLNDPYLVAGEIGAQRGHQMCYNPDRNEYLVGYFNAGVYGKDVVSYYRLDGNAIKIGGEGYVIDDMDGAGGPNVCYNSTRKEYLIVYDGYSSTSGLHNEMHVQRVDAATGALIGGSARINTPAPGRPNIAYSFKADNYLLVWEEASEPPSVILGLQLTSEGVPVGSTIHISNGNYEYSGTPRIVYNSTGDEFFVPWVVNTQVTWDAYAQRVRAGDGALIGSNITIGNTAGTEFTRGVAYDSDLNRYLVICDGDPSSPWVQFISASGLLLGPRLPVQGGDFPGGLSGIAWNSQTKEYLATWGHCCTDGNLARRLSQDGTPLGELFRINGNVTGFGNWDPLPVFNSSSGEFLIAWYWQYDNVYVRRYKPYPLPPPDVIPPAPVTGLTVTRFGGDVKLSWKNPSNNDFSGTRIRFKTTGFPADPADGTLLSDQGNAPSSLDSFTHAGLARGTYYYAVFAHDAVPNYAAAVLAAVTVQPGDFDGDGDVDQSDFAHLQTCLSGDGHNFGPGCADADLDADGDVDGDDFNAFRSCMGGAGMAPGC